MIQESLEEMNTMLRKSQKRLQHWVVESHDTKQLITSLGTVTFEKTCLQTKRQAKVNTYWIELLDLRNMNESQKMRRSEC